MHRFNSKRNIKRNKKKEKLDENQERKRNSVSQFFNHLSINNELKNKFDDFMENTIPQLYTYASHENFQITVADINARSVVRGKDKALFRHLANTINMNSTNDSREKEFHEMYILRAILKESNGKTYNDFKRNIKEYLTLLQRENYEWNVVYYSRYRHHYVVS